MKIKKYIARSMPEAMTKIKNDLGADAVILNSKEIKTGGFLGLFKHKRIEVIAALDEVKPVKKEVKRKNEQPTPVVLRTEQTASVPEKEVLTEIKQVQKMLTLSSLQFKNQYPPAFEYMFHYLCEQDVDKVIAETIIERLIAKNEQEPLDMSTLKQVMKAEIATLLTIDPGITFAKQVIQFVGPTGVGKTTTLAKVAALSMLKHKKKIAFVTTDTYRIAAIDQLKTYAKILNVPVKVAYSLKDYEEALASFASYDHIFVDTAGRNFRNAKYIQELKKMIHFQDDRIETYLVLSLTAKAIDTIETYEQFQHIPITKVIFTKLDETSTYGSLLNINIGKEKPIAYITNGQDVPDDILTPDSAMVSDLLVSRYEHA